MATLNALPTSVQLIVAEHLSIIDVISWTSTCRDARNSEMAMMALLRDVQPTASAQVRATVASLWRGVTLCDMRRRLVPLFAGSDAVDKIYCYVDPLYAMAALQPGDHCRVIMFVVSDSNVYHILKLWKTRLRMGAVAQFIDNVTRTFEGSATMIVMVENNLGTYASELSFLLKEPCLGICTNLDRPGMFLTRTTMSQVRVDFVIRSWAWHSIDKQADEMLTLARGEHVASPPFGMFSHDSTEILAIAQYFDRQVRLGLASLIRWGVH